MWLNALAGEPNWDWGSMEMALVGTGVSVGGAVVAVGMRGVGVCVGSSAAGSVDWSFCWDVDCVVCGSDVAGCSAVEVVGWRRASAVRAASAVAARVGSLTIASISVGVDTMVRVQLGSRSRRAMEKIIKKNLLFLFMGFFPFEFVVSCIFI